MCRNWMMLAALMVLSASTSLAQEPPSEPQSPPAESQEDAPGDEQKTADVSREELFKKFEESMSGIRMVGRFTITGKDDDQPPQKEEYHIRSVSKMPNGDYWMFMARIKYGDHDLSVPLPLEVKWAGQTPVITVDNVTIPGLGTFGARVVIDGKKYAGTWSHGEVGGHLFGDIEKLTAEQQREER